MIIFNALDITIDELIKEKQGEKMEDKKREAEIIIDKANKRTNKAFIISIIALLIQVLNITLMIIFK